MPKGVKRLTNFMSEPTVLNGHANEVNGHAREIKTSSRIIGATPRQSILLSIPLNKYDTMREVF